MFKVLLIHTLCIYVTNIIFSPENDSREYSPTEISHGVKQLLMKYLPDEHLARVSVKPKQQKYTDRDQRNGDIYGKREEKHNFSFASLQYMKKYNLLPSSGNFNINLQFFDDS